MNLQNNILQFQQWALQMGCPLESIPCEDAIKSIYKTRQSQLFSELTKRVQPLKVVEEAHRNFIIEAKRNCDNKTPLYSTEITKDYDAYIKVQQLKKVQQSTLKTLEQQRSEYKNEIAVLEMKSLQLTQTDVMHSKLQAQKHIFMLKVKKMDGQISQEVKKAVAISHITPLQCARYAEDELTKKLVQQSLNEINNFETKLCQQSSSNEETAAIKLKFWQEMRQIFHSLPNATVYEHITNLKMKQMQNFIELMEISKQKGTTRRGGLSNFELALVDTKIKFTEYVAQYIHARTQRMEYEMDFSDVVVQFANDVKEKIQCLQEDDQEMNEIIRAFVYQYYWKNMKQCLNEVKASQVDAINVDIEENVKKLKDHELLLEAAKQMYININMCVNSILAEINCMKNMKPKLLYPKNTFNNSVMGISSRAVKKNSELKGRIITATNAAEIQFFIETPLENFKWSMNPNPFSCLAEILPSTLLNMKLGSNAACLLFLTPQQALEQLQKDLKWIGIINAVQLTKKKELHCCIYNKEFLKEEQKSQNEQMCELMDKTEATLEYLQHLLHNNGKIYNIIEKNSLKNYVPPNKTYKNYNFNQYEMEFRNYYSITENFM